MSRKRKKRRQQQPQKKTRRSIWPLAAGGAVICSMAIIVAIISFKSEDVGWSPETEKTQISLNDDAVLERYNRLVIQLQQLHNHPNEWWLKHLPQTEEEQRLVRQKTNELALLIQQFKQVNQLTAEIALRFQKPISLINDYFNNDRLAERRLTIMPGEFPFVFLPEDYSNIEADSFAFVKDGTVFIRTIKCPQIAAAGIIFHELGHRLRFCQRLNQGLPDVVDNSLEEDIEETEMAELEYRTFNFATEGKYDQLLAEIISKVNPGNWRDLISQLTIEDIIRLDEVFEMKECGIMIGNCVDKAHIMNAALKLINNQGGALEAKVALYRWLEK